VNAVAHGCLYFDGNPKYIGTVSPAGVTRQQRGIYSKVKPVTVDNMRKVTKSDLLLPILREQFEAASKEVLVVDVEERFLPESLVRCACNADILPFFIFYSCICCFCSLRGETVRKNNCTEPNKIFLCQPDQNRLCGKVPENVERDFCALVRRLCFTGMYQHPNTEHTTHITHIHTTRSNGEHCPETYNFSDP
jgi:hypothetical protein